MESFTERSFQRISDVDPILVRSSRDLHLAFCIIVSEARNADQAGAFHQISGALKDTFLYVPKMNLFLCIDLGDPSCLLKGAGLLQATKNALPVGHLRTLCQKHPFEPNMGPQNSTPCEMVTTFDHHS